MCAPSPPPAPDYVGQAKVQGAANKEAAVASSILSNPNIITPYGQQQVTYDRVGGNQQWVPGSPASFGDYGNYTPAGQGGFQNVGGELQGTVTHTFSPEQQKLYDQQTQLSSNLNDTAISGLDRVNSTMNQDFNPSLTEVGSLQTSNPNDFQNINLDNLNPYGRLNTDNLADRTVDPTVGGQDEIYQAMMDRESQRFGERRNTTEADLIARGFNPVGAGYEGRMDEVNRAENDFSLGARQFAGAEQNRLFNMESQARQQGFGENMAMADNANRLRSMGLNEQQIAAQMNNQNVYNMFNQNLQKQQSDAVLRDRQMQEALMRRQLPLNEINALRTGNQSMLPQFQQFTGQNIAAAPIFDAALAQGNFAQQNYQNQVAGSGGLFDLAGAGLGAAGAAGGFGTLFSL